MEDIGDLARFYQMMDNLYPNQPKLNQDQKRFWYLAFREYDIEDLVRCLHEHTKNVERGRWRPEISDIMKYLSQDNSQLDETWQKFFDRKTVDDKLAVEIYERMGGLSLNRLTSKELEVKKRTFIDLYMNKKSVEKIQNLPPTAKKTLLEKK
jgi:hypothetical protein